MDTLVVVLYLAVLDPGSLRRTAGCFIFTGAIKHAPQLSALQRASAGDGATADVQRILRRGPAARAWPRSTRRTASKSGARRLTDETQQIARKCDEPGPRFRRGVSSPDQPHRLQGRRARGGRSRGQGRVCCSCSTRTSSDAFAAQGAHSFFTDEKVGMVQARWVIHQPQYCC